MSLDPKLIAERLGATYVASAPSVDSGAFGMAQLAEVLKERLDARGRRKPGNAIGWVLNSKVPVSPETARQLIALAAKMSTPDRLVNPVDLATEWLAASVQKKTKEQTQGSPPSVWDDGYASFEKYGL